MSLYKNYYIIAGYDLAPYKTDKYEDWKWTDEGEKYLCRKSKGNIQLFDDPCNGEHFFLGKVLFHGDQYEFNTEVIDLFDCTPGLIRCEKIMDELKKLYDIGIISEYDKISSQFNVFVFEEVV